MVSTLDPDLLAAAVAQTRADIDAAAARAGRAADEVEMVVAGKYIDPADTPLLAAAGVRVVGENRLQDLRAKRAACPEGLIFDFIGHLQRRKVKEVLGTVRLVHSVDSLPLAAEIARRAEGATRVLVEINVDAQPGKRGILPADVDEFIEQISEFEAITVGGLMVMPAPTVRADDSRAAFARTREMAQRLASRWAGRHDFRDLSMGTSQDFLVAVEEGATKVRVGRGLIERAQGDGWQ